MSIVYLLSSPTRKQQTGVLLQAFTSLSLFSILRMPLFQLPQLISQVINARVAIKRIEAFLSADRQGVLEEDPPVQKGASHINNIRRQRRPVNGHT